MAKNIASGFQLFADALEAEMRGAEARSDDRPLDLDATQYRVLETMVASGARRPRDIAAASVASSADLRRALVGLAAVGLVRAERHGLAPTPRGVALIRSTRPAVCARQARTQTGALAIRDALYLVVAAFDGFDRGGA